MLKLLFHPPVFVVVYLQVVKNSSFVPCAVPKDLKMSFMKRKIFYQRM